MKEDWGRLADHVIAARVRQGHKNRRAFAAYLRDLGHPVTERTLGSLERGERVSMDTVAAVEIGLNWTAGSGRATVLGGEPTTAAQVSDSGAAEDSLLADKRPEVPPYVTPENTEDWEWEIWEKLLLLTPEDKALMIEIMKGIRRRGQAADADPPQQGEQRRTG